MKKTFIVLNTILVLSAISCKKSTENGNKDVLKMETPETSAVNNNGKPDSVGTHSSVEVVNGQKTVKDSYIYKATDGTLVKVIFATNPKESTVAITSNKKTFTLQKTETKGEETIYKKDDMTVKVKGDSLHLEQGNNIIELKKTKI